MKVLYVSKNKYPETIGGAEYYIYRISQGFDHKVLTRGRVLKKIPLSSILFSFYGMIKTPFTNHDIIHSNCYWLEFSHTLCSNSVTTIHDLGFLEQYGGLIKKILKLCCRISLHTADYVVTPTNKVKDSVKDLGISEDKVIVVPNGIDLPNYSKDKKGEHLLFVGRISRNKGLEYLIEAMKIVRDNTNIKLLIVGSIDNNDYYEYLQNIVAKYRLKGAVEFKGKVSDEEKERYYMNSIVYCQPSVRSEGFGIPILEALTYGVPVVATDLFQGMEHVPNDSIVERGDATAMAEKTLSILNMNNEDYFNLSRSMREIAEEYDWRKIVEEHDKIYRRLVYG